MSDVPPTFADGEFSKSSRSDPQKDCVEVARSGRWAAIRDSKTEFGTPDDVHLVVRSPALLALLDALRIGQA